MGLSQTSAVFVLLFVTFLWGSWCQAVKHTGNYPIYVFLNWMYLFSVVIVWGAIFIFEDKMIPDGVFNEIASDPGRVALVFLCGAVYAVGMQIQLSAVSRVGLILSSSITSTCSILSGVIVSAILGGVPEGASLTMIMMSAVLLIGGTVVCQISGTMRDKDIKKGENKKTPLATKKQDIILLIFASGILQPFFSIASSVGLKTDLRPEGFSSFTCMGILCLGAFVGTAGFSAIVVTKEKMWKKVIHPDVKIGVIIGMAVISAFCHFGGNLLNAIAAPVVSIVIATGIGYSFGIWSYLWGIVYGEFSGAKKKTLGVLGCGLAFFIVGIVILTLNIT